MAMMKGKTPFMKAEDRLMEAFASEMEALGLKAHTNGISGSYRADGVFMAEPISNVIGGLACFITMVVTVVPELKKMEKASRQELPK